MIFFAIRHKPTSGFLPAGRSRGYTHDMPGINIVPRLFVSKRGAQQALRCWLKGDWVGKKSSGYSSPFGDSEYEEWIEVPDVPPTDRATDRVPADMEVVRVRLDVDA